MGFFGSMDTSTSGLTAQRLRLDIISQNIANANTTRTAEGGPYKRKAVIFEAVNNTASFDTVLNKYTNSKNNGVRVSQIIEDNKAFPTQYDPNHPDADENGYVQLPNVNMVEEMVNMIITQRGFQANSRIITSTDSMLEELVNLKR